MKVLLIYPPVRLHDPPSYPPFGLMSIAAVLEKAGMQVEIMDINMSRLSDEDVRNEICSREFDVVGIGGMVTVYYYMKWLASFIKYNYPSVPLIGGGQACSGSPEIVIKNTDFDVLVLGEGEPVIVELIDKLVNPGYLRSIPGIVYLQQGLVIKTAPRRRIWDLDSLPFPAYHLVDMDKYIAYTYRYRNKPTKVVYKRIEDLGLDREKASRPVTIFSKRGCPNSCGFCFRNFGQTVKTWSVGYVLRKMAFLESRYNTINFIFLDEMFNVSNKWIEEFCNRIIERDTQYILTVRGLRADRVNEEMLLLMKAAGFCNVSMGIESFYDPSLECMGKGQTAYDTEAAVKMIKKCGLHLISAQFLFGYPTDGAESMQVNIKKCKELGLKNAAFVIPCPYPGTILYKQAIEAGLIIDEEAFLYELADKDITDRVINMSGQPVEFLNKLMIEAGDEIKMYFMQKEHPVLGVIFKFLQRIGRVFNLSAFDIIKAQKDKIFHSGRWRNLPWT